MEGKFARLRHAVTRAYAGKYDTKASKKWVRGFAAAPRRHHVGAIARAAVAGARSVKLGSPYRRQNSQSKERSISSEPTRSCGVRRTNTPRAM